MLEDQSLEPKKSWYLGLGLNGPQAQRPQKHKTQTKISNFLTANKLKFVFKSI
jgi:hypothetical protein